MQNTIPTTATISVSRKEPLDCRRMAEFLGAAGIKTSVTENFTAQPESEHGCRLVQSVTTKNEVAVIWNKLQTKYGFACAHINVGNKFDGCILDFLAPSLCGTKPYTIPGLGIYPADSLFF